MLPEPPTPSGQEAPPEAVGAVGEDCVVTGRENCQVSALGGGGGGGGEAQCLKIRYHGDNFDFDGLLYWFFFKNYSLFIEEGQLGLYTEISKLVY